MDYIFRWIQIRFLSGHQLDLFSGLAPQSAVPVEGTVHAPGNRVVPSLNASSYEGVIPTGAAGGVEGPASLPGMYSENTYTTTPPQQGIAPDPTYTASSVSSRPERSGVEGSASPLTMEDRGIYHAATAMKSMVDMGDAPSCSTCGAIMTRNGSCYRCMECGSTSGCS